MKGIHLTMFILGIISISSFLVGGLLIGTDGLNVVMNYDNNNFGESYIINENYIINETVQRFVINSVSAEVVFHYGEEASVSLNGASTAENPPYLDVKEEGDIVYVTVRYPLQSTWFFEGISHLTLDLFVTEPIEAYITTVSSDIFANEVAFVDSSFESVSGDMMIGMISGMNRARSTSGNIQIQQVIGESNASTVSGDITINQWDVEGKNTIETTSGDVHIETSSTSSFSFSIDTISGDITPRNIYVNTIDGKHITGKKNGEEGILNIDTVSGDIILS